MPCHNKICSKHANNSLTFFLFAYWHEAGWKGFVGATVKIRDMAVNLSALGHDVVLFVPKCGIDTKQFDFEVVEIPVIDLPGLRMLSFNFFLGFCLLLGGFEARPDVVYLRRTTSIIPLLYARLCQAAFFFEVNDDPYYGENSLNMPVFARIRYIFSVMLDEWNMRSADRIFVISEAIIEKIRRKNPGLASGGLVLMQSGANTALFSPEDPETARTVLGLETRGEYICFVGSLLPHQGVGVLINAVPMILKERPGCCFLVIGEGPMKGEWEAQVADLGISEKFIFTGQVPYEHVPDWIRAADLCVAPYAVNAGFRSPVKIFDYLACGRAVVASRIEGTTDIFSGIDAVRLVEPEVPGNLAEAVLSILGDPAYREQIARSGRAWVKKNYSRAAMARKVSDAASGLMVKRKRHKKG